jgi:predicted ferric reductase
VAAAATYGLFRWVHAARHVEPSGTASALVSASGAAALLWAYAGLVLGLLVGLRLPRSLVRQRHRLLLLHRQTNLVVLGLMVLHLTAFAAGTPGGSWVVSLVPQTAPVAGAAYTLGVVSFYLAALLGPTYYLRRWLGRRVWLVAHQFAALVYALALWHALWLGPHLRLDGPWREALWVAQIPLLILLGLRYVRPRRPADRYDAAAREPRYRRLRYAVLRIAVAAGIGGTALVVLAVTLAALGRGLHSPGR